MWKSDNERDFFFQILQYNNVDITMKCIRSIWKMYYQERIGIVVVDNHSSDGAGDNLVKYLKEDPQIENRGKGNEDNPTIYEFRHKSGCWIDVICRKVNDGFSKGNNYGYRYIKDKYFINYLVVANSDVEFQQSNFVGLVEEEYTKSGFDILGPDIWAPIKEVHQNPLSYSIPTEDEVNRTIILNKFALLFFEMTYPILKKHIGISRENKEKVNNREENICLQGSCLIYSEKYIVKREQISLCNKDTQIANTLFFPETNFYYEEFLQTLWCQKNGCKMVYTPDICVNHMEGASTDTISIFEKEKIKFKMKNILESAKIYKEQYLSYRK